MTLSEREVRALSNALTHRRGPRPWVGWVTLWLAGAALLALVFTLAWVLIPYTATQGGVGLVLILVALAAFVWGAR